RSIRADTPLPLQPQPQREGNRLPVNTAQFKEHFASAAPEQAEPPLDDVFIPFRRLPDHGVAYSRAHLRRLIAGGLFPRPVMLSPNRIAWRRSDVLAWKASRMHAPLPVLAS